MSSSPERRPLQGRAAPFMRPLLPFLAAVFLTGCIGVNVGAPTPTPPASTFVTPGPDETLPPDVTPEPDATPIPTPRPARTPKPTAKAARTPKPTTKPAKTPKPTMAPTDEPTAPPTDAPSETSWPSGALDTEAAADREGETGIVCGTVVAAQYVQTAPGRPTFLNIDAAYPNQRFNVVIWGEQRRQFPLAGKPEVVMIGKQICTKGLIEGYSDYTQIQDVGIDEVDILP